MHQNRVTSGFAVAAIRSERLTGDKTWRYSLHLRLASWQIRVLAAIGFFDGRGHGNQVLHLGHPEELKNPRADADQHQPDAFLPAPGRMADQHA